MTLDIQYLVLCKFTYLKSIKIIKKTNKNLVPRQASDARSPRSIPSQVLGKAKPGLQCFKDG